MFTITGSLISILYGITSGGVLHSWSSAQIISSLIIGHIGIAAFVIYESRVAKEPMIPMRIFQNRTAASAILSAFIIGLVLWAMEYYLILYVSRSRQCPTSVPFLIHSIKVPRQPPRFSSRCFYCHPIRYSDSSSISGYCWLYHHQDQAFPNYKLHRLGLYCYRICLDDSLNS